MIRLNKKTEYALITLKEMSGRAPGALTTAREISDLYKTPFDTTSKVMQGLNSAGILKSVKGIHGGYILDRPLAQVSYMELVEVVEGRSFVMNCDGSKGPCELLETCNITGPVQVLNHKLVHLFKNLSIDELLGSSLLKHEDIYEYADTGK